MRTVVLGQRPPELEGLIASRRALGQDGYDEMWEGEYHVAPPAHTHRGILDVELAVLLRPWALRAGLIGSGAFNLGSPDDYRVPDGGFHRSCPDGVYAATAPLVVEILSPDDETFAKFDFYARHGVLEVLVVDPEERTVCCYDLVSGQELPVSQVLGIDLLVLAAEVAWPAGRA